MQHPPRVKNTHNFKICFKEFSGFYALRQLKTNEHGLQMKSGEFDVSNLLEDDNADLKEEIQACEHFLVDSELEKGRHRVFNFAMSTFDSTLINKKRIDYSKDPDALPKLTLRLDLFSKTLKMDLVDIFTLTRTIRLWRVRNLCVRQPTLQTWKRNYRKWLLWIFVHEREPIPNGSFTN